VADLIVRPLDPADALDHLPDDVREEVMHFRLRCTVIAGFVGKLPVSFAFARCSERLGDISIDTLAEYRNRGFGAATAAALVDHLVARGIEPVWGAVESNHASLRLAEKLGFTKPAGELFVCEE
jgi:GNAT superfamily N-acetyltransferase